MQVRAAAPGERPAKIVEMQRTRRESLRKGVVEVLKPEQAARFYQLLVQQQGGVLAFELPHVQEALKLTEHQKAHIQAINLAESELQRDSMHDIQKDPQSLGRHDGDTFRGSRGIWPC